MGLGFTHWQCCTPPCSIKAPKKNGTDLFFIDSLTRRYRLLSSPPADMFRSASILVPAQNKKGRAEITLPEDYDVQK